MNRSGGRGSRSVGGSRQSDSHVGDSEEPEIQSPLKQNSKEAVRDGEKGEPSANRQLVFEAMEEDNRNGPRKRKSKQGSKIHTPDLNAPLELSGALVPAGLVNSRVSKLDGAGDGGGGGISETLKKQKRGNSQNAGSAAATCGSPRRAL